MKLIKYILLLITSVVFGQNKYGSIKSDCPKSRVIKISRPTKVDSTVAPIGYGDQQEIKKMEKSNNFSFEKEHNSAWYMGGK